MASALLPCASCCGSGLRAARRRPQPGGAPLVCQAVDPAALQEILVGGAVTAATAAAIINGSGKGEPEVCASCAGSGGVKCFACEGSGKMAGVSREALAAAARQRDPLGRGGNLRECTACKGAGMLFCRKCSGSGFSKRM